LISLQQLYLQENQINWIEPFSFDGLRSLQQLYLFRNQLYYIEAKTFHGLFSLSELNLGVNNISGLANNAFHGLPRLLVLQLNSNRLTSIPAKAFYKLRNLFRLVIYYNRIAFVAPGAFEDLKKLKSIVWYPPLALIRNSKKLQSFKSNNLHCDCNIKWLKDWLSDNNNKSPIYCESPLYLKGWNVTSVEEKFLKCENIHASVHPMSSYALTGSPSHFQCNVNINANFTWMHNGSMLTSTKQYFQTTSGLLILRNVSKQDSGQYTCVVTSSEGIFAASAILKIGETPQVNKIEESIIVKSSDQIIEIKCNATGIPPPFHRWYQNGRLVVDGKRNMYIGYDGKLLITKFDESYSGIYKCVVQNELGRSEKIISVRYDILYSPCQPICSKGSVCLKKYSCECLIPETCAVKSAINSTTPSEEGSGGGYVKKSSDIEGGEFNDDDEDDDDDDYEFTNAWV